MPFRLYEARERLGGRILSQPTQAGGRVDLGPTWFWPETQPSITRLIEDLGLPTQAQTRAAASYVTITKVGMDGRCHPRR